MADAVTKSPVIKDITQSTFETNMYSMVDITFGDPMTSVPNADNPGPPFFMFTDMPAGVSNTNSHYHPDYSFLMFPTGGYEINGTFFPAGTVMLTEPGAITGECGPAAGGSTETGFYPSTWASVPFFIDPTDPRSIAMMEGLGEVGTIFLNTPPPPPNPEASFKLLDREQDGIKTESFTAYPCQLGEKGFGTVPSASDPSRYAVLVEFEAGASVPQHHHDGWFGLIVVKGAIELGGQRIEEYVLAGFPAGTPVSLNVGSKPATVVFYAESGKAAIPIFADQSVFGVDAFQTAFGKA